MNFTPILKSPFFTFCIPPGMAVGQFLLGSYLFSMGFPEIRPDQKVYAGILISLLFAICVIPLLGMALGFRQVLSGQTKALSALGMAFNGLYFIGCVFFFIMVFVTHTSN